MSNALDAAAINGQLLALQIVVRALAKQVSSLSDGEPFLETELARSVALLDGMSATVGAVEELPEANKLFVDRMLNEAKTFVAKYFAPASNDIGPVLRH